ncbi:RNA polymerase sigma factor [Lysinibacillus sp. BF-4]|uniref:RNA polymerase sigma factor n=1 Tax=Lysinibacillus sp. BF-4 TaxID=1473546 RepID=UPI00055A73E8|nr:RNA polymerase sigma factor [Lysinibacillus sp. BF-4]
MPKRELEDWYNAYSTTIYQYVFFLVRDVELAEDITQETFYRAYKQAARFRQQASVKTWLHRIARNAAYDELRRKRLIAFVTFTKQHEPQMDDLALRSLLTKELHSKLYQAISQLKLVYRDVLVLRYIEELSVKDTAQILGFSESKVKSTAARALQSLTTIMKERGWDDEMAR